MTADRITKFLDDACFLGVDRYKLVQGVRKEVLGLDKSISEEIKYGGILFAGGKPSAVFSRTQSTFRLSLAKELRCLTSTRFWRAKVSFVATSSFCL